MTEKLSNFLPILYNPHVDDFLGEPPHFKFLRRRAIKKYGFFLDGLKNTGVPIAVLVDGTISAFIPSRLFRFFPKILRAAISAGEFSIWLSRNNIKTSQIRLITESDSVDNCILFGFSYKSASYGFNRRLERFRQFRIVVMHLSHYFVNSSLKSANLSKLDNVVLAGDSDCTQNTYFQTFFAWYRKPFLVLTFSVSDRFSYPLFRQTRLSKCVASGTFHKLEFEQPQALYRDYRESTGLNTLHPLRRAIYDSRMDLIDRISCLISPYRNYRLEAQFLNWITHFGVSQKRYFSLNITDAYQTHQFAVVGEEAVGFPAIGALEAMACGAVVIANPECYRGLGLEVGKHFLGYDGSLKNLISVLDSSESLAQLELIGVQASDFISQNFRDSITFHRWIRQFESLFIL